MDPCTALHRLMQFSQFNFATRILTFRHINVSYVAELLKIASINWTIKCVHERGADQVCLDILRLDIYINILQDCSSNFAILSGDPENFLLNISNK